ncbi:MAG: type II toxin-antitoxin system PemK/MazF family toxin [Candidatus Methanoplasma sp.]|jgi:mRNA-degrading endonuclease toxin of MazEF toxin-antitoxin module|nr:type II toxin-antitoxin system PemK/MazF family toxin [Candidatus Methanoplasma sp.]
MKSSDKPRMWEIWLADVEFEGAPGHKKRPVLVLGAKAGGIELMEITSQPIRRTFADVEVPGTVDTGLEKDSIIRTGRRRTVPREAMIRRLGEVADEPTKSQVRKAANFFETSKEDD